MACSVCLLERRPVLCVCLRDGLSCVFVREMACSVCCVPVAKYGTKAQRAMACDCVPCVVQGASAALTEARRNAKKAGKRYSRHRHDSK